MKIETEKINISIEKGLNFLHQNQLPSGEFKSYRSTHPTMAENCEFDSSPFPTSLISYSLSFSDSTIAKQMINRAIEFFLSEMERGSVWRYWTSIHQYHKNIPPDLDDIACISAVLKQNGVHFSDNRNLILANRNRQKLFYTWLAPRFAFPFNLEYWRIVGREALNPISLYYFWKVNESEVNDVDGVVNANVLYYLGKSRETQATINYLIEIINQNREESCDKWHLSRYNLYYSLSKNYFAGIDDFEIVRDLIIKRIISDAKSDGMIGENVLETSLAVCSLINLKHQSTEIDKAIEFILNQQNHSGAWQIFPFYYGGPKKYYGWGSEEITTGFCLEVLFRY